MAIARNETSQTNTDFLTTGSRTRLGACISLLIIRILENGAPVGAATHKFESAKLA
jgi:hypothetical protein